MVSTYVVVLGFYKAIGTVYCDRKTVFSIFYGETMLNRQPVDGVGGFTD